jgi:hypothetical protein
MKRIAVAEAELVSTLERCSTVALATTKARQPAANGVNEGLLLVIVGPSMPIAPAISATPKKSRNPTPSCQVHHTTLEQTIAQRGIRHPAERLSSGPVASTRSRPWYAPEEFYSNERGSICCLTYKLGVVVRSNTNLSAGTDARGYVS